MNRILNWLLKDTEEELYSQYKTDVIDCHPEDDLPPITYDQFKEHHNRIYSNTTEKTKPTIPYNQPKTILEDNSRTMEIVMEA